MGNIPCVNTANSAWLGWCLLCGQADYAKEESFQQSWLVFQLFTVILGKVDKHNDLKHVQCATEFSQK